MRYDLLIPCRSDRSSTFLYDIPATFNMPWIECEIRQKGLRQDVLERLILLLYDGFVQRHRVRIESWHFFREPTLRFRVMVKEKNLEWASEELSTILDTDIQISDLIDNWYFSRHGKPDEWYTGEEETYGPAWRQHFNLWEAGAELAVQVFRNRLDRRFQFVRVRHLVYNQILPATSERG